MLSDIVRGITGLLHILTRWIVPRSTPGPEIPVIPEGDRVILALSECPLGMIVHHRHVPSVVWRVIRYVRDEEGGPISGVVVQRVGGAAMNRAKVRLDATVRCYIGLAAGVPGGALGPG